jgi:hypothetical protein
MTCDRNRKGDPGRRSVVATLGAAAVMSAVGARRAAAQDVELVVDVATVAKGYRASRLAGQEVVNDLRERLGTIDDFIFGRDDRGLFAVLRIGAVGALGGHLVAVPFSSLVLNDVSGKIVLPRATRDALNKLPVFTHGS